MKIIKDLKEFKSIEGNIKNKLGLDIDNRTISNSSYSNLMEFDYEFVIVKNFYKIVFEICKLNGTNEFFYMILDPSPTEYFNKHFGSFNTYIFNSLDNEKSFLEMLNHDPGDSPADCPGSNSFLICIGDFKYNWFFIADRYKEMAGFYSKDDNLSEAAQRIINKMWVQF